MYSIDSKSLRFHRGRNSEFYPRWKLFENFFISDDPLTPLVYFSYQWSMDKIENSDKSENSDNSDKNNNRDNHDNSDNDYNSENSDNSDNGDSDNSDMSKTN